MRFKSIQISPAKISLRRYRRGLFVSTAWWLAGALPAAAQTAPAPAPLNLGSVVANGQSGGAPLPASPSATGTLKQAQQLQKLSPNVLSVQPQSQIQKLPDVNVAEALQRVPGVSLETDTGEGRFINIRGMDADLNGTSFDNVHLTASNQATPTGGARAVAFDAFPAGAIGGVEVVKSLTPDIDAEGLGGSVNLLPIQLPADGSPLAEASIAGGEETLRDTGIYQAELTLGDSFAAPGMASFANSKPLGLIGNYTIDADRRGIDDVEEDYNSPTNDNQPASLQDLQFRHYDGHRVRQGFSGELDFTPSPQTSFYIRGLHGGYDEQLDKNRLELDGLDGSNDGGALIDNGGGNYTAVNATAQKDYTNSNERIGYDLFAFGGKTVVADAVDIDFRGSWTEGYDITSRSYSTKFEDATPFTVNYSTANADYRTYSVAGGVDLTDPNNYNFHSASNSPGRSFDQEFGAAVNASFATNLLGYVGEAKFGGDMRLRSEGTVQNEFDYNGVNGDPSLAALDGGNPNTVYYNARYAIGPDVGYQPLFGALNGATQNIDSTLQSFAHNSENVYAGYGQETVELGNLEVLAGVRVEATDATYRANLAETGDGGPVAGSTYYDAGSDTNYIPNSNKQSYVNVFPSAQFKYAFSPQFQMRAAYSTAIARPGFQQISAAKSVDLTQSPVAITQGNPSLKPTTGNSFDVTAEYYSRHDGLLSADIFYKQFSNYIVSTLTNSTYEGQPAQITSYENIGGAYLRGMELDAEQKFTFLPTPLDGFGIDGNITFVDSHGHFDPGLKANELPETSPITYNAQLFYEKGPINFRVAAAYVSRNLFSVGGTRDTDQFSNGRFRLDMSASYSITPNLEIFAEGKNLTNTLLEFTSSASSAYPIQREYYQVDYLVGLRARL